MDVNFGETFAAGKNPAVTLKEETIFDQWSMVLDNAAGNEDDLLVDIVTRFKKSEIPGRMTKSEVKSSGWMSKVKRNFLIITNEQFSDYHMYISARDYGVHLDVCRFLTIEPGHFKKMLSSRLTGDAEALSGPKNILVEQDLRAWVTVVHHCVLGAVESMMKKLNQDTSEIRRESKGYLNIW